MVSISCDHISTFLKETTRLPFSFIKVQSRKLYLDERKVLYKKYTKNR